MAIIGSGEYQTRTGITDPKAAKAHLRNYLRYALVIDPGLSQIVIRKGAGDFDVNHRILSRAEVYWAWRKLRREWRQALYYRLVGGMSVEEVAAQMGVSRATVYHYIEAGLTMMWERVFEKLEEIENT